MIQDELIRGYSRIIALLGGKKLKYEAPEMITIDDADVMNTLKSDVFLVQIFIDYELKKRGYNDKERKRIN